jgi:HK97 family phage major capsid protein
MNRTATGILLPKEISQQIWQDAQDSSAVMRFATRIDLPGAGVQIPMITGDPTAQWVSETNEIAVGESTFSSKAIAGYKLGVIELFSNEFKRDLPGLYRELAKRLPKTLGLAFDATVFHGAAPGADFDELRDVQALNLDTTDTYGDLVAIESAISLANGTNTGYVLSPRARGLLLNARDADNRPLLLNDIQREGGVSQLLGVPVDLTRAVYKEGVEDTTPEVLGFAGDWSQAMYGVVEGIEVAVSSEATVSKTVGGTTTQVNLFQRDMFALRVTAHLGFAVRDKSKLVRITGATPNDEA